MEQLKLAWVHRFWIAIGVAVLVPIIGYFVNTRSLASQTGQRANALENTKKKLESLQRGPNPNDSWRKAVNKLEQELRKDVDGAWEVLYSKQFQFMTWPPELEQVFVKAGPNGGVPPAARLKYREAYILQFEDAIKTIQPWTPLTPEGLVEIVIDELYALQPTWVQASGPPSVSEVWLAQEDIWILRALFDVVARANRDSTKLRDSAIKRILDVEIGAAAVADSRAQTQLIVPGTTGTPAAGATTTTIRTEAGRYIPSQDDTLFKLIPVYMSMVVDQRRVVDILAEFASSGIPTQVTQVRFYGLMERAETSLLGRMPQGPGSSSSSIRVRGGYRPTAKQRQDMGVAPAKEDEFFHMTQLDVWAEAYLFQPPPSMQQAGG